MKFKVTFLVAIVNSVLTNLLPEDGRLNFTGLSVKYGPKAEEHSVVTEDGYILGLFHLPGKRKLPVLLLHGLSDSADTFIIRGNRSLAITLANRGYDVWVGNTRGNRYSRRHTKLNPDTDPSFWDFSFHENGYYDLAAITDYILNATGVHSLQSIGHSQGTTNHFVLGSQRPEYNKKIEVFIALAPVAFLNKLIQPMSFLAEMGPLMNEILLALKKEELFRDKGFEKSLVEMICNQGAVSYELCRKFLFDIAGYDLGRFEPEFVPVVNGHYPAACSRKGILHYSQVAIQKRFALFDYGPAKNLEHYGTTFPPDYNLKLMTMKTALFVGKNDRLSPVGDAEHLRLLLANIVQYYLMKPKEWNHIDFVWANDMPETLFPDIFLLLDKYT